LNRLKAGESRAVSKTLAALLDGNTEFTFSLFSPAIRDDLFDRFPSRMAPVGCRCTSTDVYNVVPTLNQCGNEVRSDVSTPSNDDDPSHSLPPFNSSFYKLLLTA
jgi:hypothetical protein